MTIFICEIRIDENSDSEEQTYLDAYSIWLVLQYIQYKKMKHSYFRVTGYVRTEARAFSDTIQIIVMFRFETQ